MPKFVNAFTWNQAPDAEYLSLVPAQLEWVSDMVARGMLLHLFIAADNIQGWAIYNADSVEQIMEQIKQMPLYKFMNVNLIKLSADFSAPQ
jgi:muconolactone delta-isomerase